MHEELTLLLRVDFMVAMTVLENNDEKFQKFGPHFVASEITKELKKQKNNRKG